jgi:hypothetical protein
LTMMHMFKAPLCMIMDNGVSNKGAA